MKNKLNVVLEYFGTQGALSRALGVTRASVSVWFANDRMPPKRAIEIEKITKGKIKAVDIIV